MNPTILVAIISFSGSIILAALSYFLSKQQQIKTEWQHEKMNHYKVLLSALSDLAVSGRDKRKGQENFSLATNTICLVAPQYVVSALMKLHEEIKISNRPKYSQEKEYVLVKKLMLAIRKDIGVSKKDEEKTFEFHFIGYNPEYEKK